MGSEASTYVEETLLGSGNLFMKLYETDGTLKGAVDFGECSLFGISAPSLEKKELIGHRLGTFSETIKSVITKKEQDVKLTGHDFNKFTLGLALLGTGAAYTQTASTDGSPVTVVGYLDKWSDLDKYNLDPETPPVVQDDADTITYVEDTDYEIDYTYGRILVLSSGSITDEEDLHIVSTWLAVANGFEIDSGTVNLIEARLELFGRDQANDRNFIVIVYKAQLEPSGDLNLLSEDFGTNELTGKILATTDGTIKTRFLS